MGKFALLIGVSEYVSGLQPLPKAVLDVEKLEQILNNPEIGGFEKVDVLKNPERQPMEVKIEEFLVDSGRDDLLLLYFSGHGVVDEAGNFYLSSRSTCLNENRLRTATAVKARDIHGWMSNCKAKRQAVILDCCNAGAFAKGLTTKDVGKIDIKAQLGGEGRAVLTAATSTQYAFEQEGLDLSIYTHYLVEGLEKGAADLNDDGQISVEELHEYVFKKVKEAAPAMTPEIYNLARDTEPILIARSPKDDPKLKYRKEVEKRLHQGQFSIPARRLLNRRRIELGIEPGVAEAIEAEALQPWRERERNLQEYRETLEEALSKENPLSDRTQRDLQDYQQALGLRDEDVAAIQAELLVPSASSEATVPSVEPEPSHPSAVTVYSSETGVDYTELRDLLAANEWEAADRATDRLMFKAAKREEQRYLDLKDIENFPCLDLKDIENFPCEDLRIINELWISYSQGKFGFSVQKRIWQECGSPVDYNDDWTKFCERIGWLKDGEWVRHESFHFDLQNSPPGELPLEKGRGFAVFSPHPIGVSRDWVSSLAHRLANCSIQ